MNQLTGPTKVTPLKHRIQDWLISKMTDRISQTYVQEWQYDDLSKKLSEARSTTNNLVTKVRQSSELLEERAIRIDQLEKELVNTRATVESHIVGGWTRQANVAGTVIQIHIPNTGMPPVEKLQQELAVAVKDVPTDYALASQGVISLKELEQSNDYRIGQ